MGFARSVFADHFRSDRDGNGSEQRLNAGGQNHLTSAEKGVKRETTSTDAGTCGFAEVTSAGIRHSVAADGLNILTFRAKDQTEDS